MNPEQQERLLSDLRWYGHEIAGGGPMIGYATVARRAEAHWYSTTLPLLEELNAVYPVKSDEIQKVEEVR